MSAYPAGTVAVATARGVEGVRVFRWESGWCGMNALGSFWSMEDEDFTDIRPLIVLDLGGSDAFDGSDWRSVINNLRDPNCRLAAEGIADQIEAQTKPPKPREPIGIGAVVQDDSRRWWTRVRNDDHEGPQWQRVDNEPVQAEWDAIAAVKVLSDGVRP